MNKQRALTIESNMVSLRNTVLNSSNQSNPLQWHGAHGSTRSFSKNYLDVQRSLGPKEALTLNQTEYPVGLKYHFRRKVRNLEKGTDEYVLEEYPNPHREFITEPFEASNIEEYGSDRVGDVFLIERVVPVEYAPPRKVELPYFPPDSPITNYTLLSISTPPLTFEFDMGDADLDDSMLSDTASDGFHPYMFDVDFLQYI